MGYEDDCSELITAKVPFRRASTIYYRFFFECNSPDIDAISWQWSVRHPRHRPGPSLTCAWTHRAAIVGIRSGNGDRHRTHDTNADIGRHWLCRSVDTHSHDWRRPFDVALCMEYPLAAMPPGHFSTLLTIPGATRDTQSPSWFSLLVHCIENHILHILLLFIVNWMALVAIVPRGHY